MDAETIQAHVEYAADGADANNVGPIKVQENRADGQHLAAVVSPNFQYLTEE